MVGYQSSFEGLGFTEAQVAELVSRALEAQASQAVAGDLSIKVLKQEVAELMSKIERQDAERPEEQFVANLVAGKHGVVHVISTSSHTACGWSWGTSSSAVLRAEVDLADNVCTKCMSWKMASL